MRHLNLLPEQQTKLGNILSFLQTKDPNTINLAVDLVLQEPILNIICCEGYAPLHKIIRKYRVNLNRPSWEITRKIEKQMFVRLMIQCVLKNKIYYMYD